MGRTIDYTKQDANDIETEEELEAAIAAEENDSEETQPPVQETAETESQQEPASEPEYDLTSLEISDAEQNQGTASEETQPPVQETVADEPQQEPAPKQEEPVDESKPAPTTPSEPEAAPEVKEDTLPKELRIVRARLDTYVETMASNDHRGRHCDFSKLSLLCNDVRDVSRKRRLHRRR